MDVHDVFAAMDQAGWEYDWSSDVFRKACLECSYDAAVAALSDALDSVDRSAVAANEP